MLYNRVVKYKLKGQSSEISSVTCWGNTRVCQTKKYWLLFAGEIHVCTKTKKSIVTCLGKYMSVSQPGVPLLCHNGTIIWYWPWSVINVGGEKRPRKRLKDFFGQPSKKDSQFFLDLSENIGHNRCVWVDMSPSINDGYKGSLSLPKRKNFWKIFERPLTPPPLFWEKCCNFFCKIF